MLKAILGRVLGLNALDRVFERICDRMGNRTFVRTAVEQCRFGIDLPPAHRGRIPAAWPLVVVANHPTGAMEGLVVPAIVESAGRDVRTLSHVWFQRYAKLAREMFLIDPGAQGPARADNRIAVTAAIRWVREGGALVMFPAGEVARFDWRQRRVADRTWRPGVASIVRATRATVLPVYVEARNGALYHLLSSIHRRLGALWLIRELLAKQGTTLRVRIGQPISYEELSATNGNGELTARLRQAVDVLRSHETDPADRTSGWGTAGRPVRETTR